MKKIMAVVFVLAAVLLCGGCASTATKNGTTAGTPASQELSAPEAAGSDESANNGSDGIASAVADAKDTLKNAVDETAAAVKKSARDIGHKAGHFGKEAAAVVAEDLTSVKNAAATAVKDKNGWGKFPWWIIILIIILIILFIYFRSTGKKDKQPQ